MQFTDKKLHILKCTKDSKINQSIFKSSWVPNLGKCMHVIYENNERYHCKTARWIPKKKKNAMHVNPKHKWCMKI